jgi:hypothetical protein
MRCSFLVGADGCPSPPGTRRSNGRALGPGIPPAVGDPSDRQALGLARGWYARDPVKGAPAGGSGYDILAQRPVWRRKQPSRLSHWKARACFSSRHATTPSVTVPRPPVSLEGSGLILKQVCPVLARPLDPQDGQRGFRPGARPDPATVMSFVGEHRDLFGVEPILRVLQIAVSTFYGWLAPAAPPLPAPAPGRLGGGQRSARSTRARVGPTGCPDPRPAAPRRHPHLPQAGGAADGTAGLQGAFLRKRWRCSTRQDPTAMPAPDLVNRDFTAPAPNRLWVADSSRIGTGEGPL